MKNNKLIQLNELLWYILGSAIPIAISLARSPIFTREFTTIEYGYYTVVFVTYNLLSIVFLSWIKSCVWRFYFNFKNNNALNTLRSNIIIFSVVSVIFLTIITLVYYLLVDNDNLKKLIWYCFLSFLSSEVFMLALIPARLEGKARLFNILNSIRAAVGFGVTCYLTFILHYRIEAILIGNTIVNAMLILVIAIIHIKEIKHIRLQIPVRVNEFLKFGGTSIVSSLSFVALSSIDRYLINYFGEIEQVGIYNQVFNLSNLSLVALIIVFFNTINPALFKQLENNETKNNTEVLKLVILYLYIFLPGTLYLSIYSKPIATLMLGPDFRVGYSMLPYLSFSAFIYGFILFSEQRLKFKNNYKTLLFGSLIALLLNLVLNLILIPNFGYKTAAITTLISNIVLLLMFTPKSTIKYKNICFFRKDEVFIALLLTVQVIIHYLLKFDKLYMIGLELFLFLSSYFLMAFNRIKSIINIEE